MLKEESFHNPGDGIYVTSFKEDLRIEKITSRESFIALVITDRIVNASAQAGVLPRQGNLPGINHLWSLLYRHIDTVIKDLNLRIAGGAAVETLLRRLVDLLSIDVSAPNQTRSDAIIVLMSHYSFRLWTLHGDHT